MQMWVVTPDFIFEAVALEICDASEDGKPVFELRAHAHNGHTAIDTFETLQDARAVLAQFDPTKKDVITVIAVGVSPEGRPGCYEVKAPSRSGDDNAA